MARAGSAEVAVRRLRYILNPLHQRRYAKQCQACKLLMIRADDHICMLGNDTDALDVCNDWSDSNEDTQG